MTKYKDYLLARLPEVTTRLGGLATTVPLFVDLSDQQTFTLLFVAIVLLGVPEDRIKFKK